MESTGGRQRLCFSQNRRLVRPMSWSSSSSVAAIQSFSWPCDMVACQPQDLSMQTNFPSAYLAETADGGPFEFEATIKLRWRDTIERYVVVVAAAADVVHSNDIYFFPFLCLQFAVCCSAKSYTHASEVERRVQHAADI